MTVPVPERDSSRRGTDSSNPFPSSGESVTNLTSRAIIRAVAARCKPWLPARPSEATVARCSGAGKASSSGAIRTTYNWLFEKPPSVVVGVDEVSKVSFEPIVSIVMVALDWSLP